MKIVFNTKHLLYFSGKPENFRIKLKEDNLYNFCKLSNWRLVYKKEGEKWEYYVI